MKRISLRLPDDLAVALILEARRRGVSQSQVAREAISTHLSLKGERRELPFVSLGRSGYQTTSQDVEEILRSEWLT